MRQVFHGDPDRRCFADSPRWIKVKKKYSTLQLLFRQSACRVTLIAYLQDAAACLVTRLVKPLAWDEDVPLDRKLCLSAGLYWHVKYLAWDDEEVPHDRKHCLQDCIDMYNLWLGMRRCLLTGNFVCRIVLTCLSPLLDTGGWLEGPVTVAAWKSSKVA